MAQARLPTDDKDRTLIHTEAGQSIAGEQFGRDGMEILFITEQGTTNEIIKVPMYYRGMLIV